MQAVQQVFSNPLWTLLIGIAVTIVVAVIIYNRSRKARKPTFYIRSHNLVADFSSKITKLKMLYSDKQIERLTVSKIAFWNDGTETISKEDVADSEPLRIEAVGSCDILDAKVIKEINPVSKFRVEKENNKLVRILFDFLDKGQGGAIQIMHTGKESSDIKVDGFVKGAGKPRSSYTRSRVFRVLDKIFSPPKQTQPNKPPPAKIRRITAIVSFGAAIIMLIPVFLNRSLPEEVFGAVAFLLYIYFGYILLKRRVPKGLEIVEEEEI